MATVAKTTGQTTDTNDALVSWFNYINKTNYFQNILLCSKCNQWLLPPIYTLVNGNHLCLTCNQSETSKTKRNRAPEYISNVSLYMCKYFKEGCGFICKLAKLKEHEENCVVERSNFRCCLCDFLTEETYDMEKHLKNTHELETIEATVNTVQVVLTKPNFRNFDGIELYMYFISISRNNFIVKIERDNRSGISIMICEPFGVLPQYLFTASLNSGDSEGTGTNYIYTNWNQLNSQLQNDYLLLPAIKNGLVSVDITFGDNSKIACKNRSKGCFANADHSGCSYEFVNCCNNTCGTFDLYTHLRETHKNIILGELNNLPKQWSSSNEIDYWIEVDSNMFNLNIARTPRYSSYGDPHTMKATINWKYQFGLNYSYKCTFQTFTTANVVSETTEVISRKTQTIELKPKTFSDKWKLYILRVRFED